MKYFYIESLGCSKNQVDSETIITLLQNKGYIFTHDANQADLILVNTCGFIETAKQESINSVMGFRALYPDKKIIMTGCLSQRYFNELEKDLTEIDGMWGTEYSDSFASFVENRAGAVSETPAVSEGISAAEQRPKLSFPGTAYVKIAEGCANKCSYCAIPIIRGDLHSRPKKEIFSEIRQLTELGIQEINLVAQDSASYGTDKGTDSITTLIKDILGLDTDFWLRVLYLHPDKFTADLLSIAQSDPRFIPYFDIPFQHASQSILKKMGRKGNKDSYRDLIKDIRDTIPEAVIRTTFLTGFPGETEEDFGQLLEFQQEIRPNWAGMFTYSKEEGTIAFGMKPQVSAQTAKKRKSVLETAQETITTQWLKGITGKKYRVLIEEEVQEEDLLLARTWFQAPEVDGLTVVEGSSAKPGDRILVQITGCSGVDLTAIAIPDNSAAGVR